MLFVQDSVPKMISGDEVLISAARDSTLLRRPWKLITTAFSFWFRRFELWLFFLLCWDLGLNYFWFFDFGEEVIVGEKVIRNVSCSDEKLCEHSRDELSSNNEEAKFGKPQLQQIQLKFEDCIALYVVEERFCILYETKCCTSHSIYHADLFWQFYHINHTRV